MIFCEICNSPVVATCDRTQKSELIPYKGESGLKTKPQFMWMYPTAKVQNKLCFYHQQLRDSKGIK